MKKIILLIGLICMILFSVNSYSQKSLVYQAQNYSDAGQVSKAYDYISIATDPNNSKASSTIDWHRTWDVKGEICQKIFELKNPLLNEPLSVALDSYMKAISLDNNGRYLPLVRIRMKLLNNDFITQAVDAFQSEDYEKSLKSFESIMKIASIDFMKENPNEIDTVIIYNAGLAAYNANNWEKAILYFREATKHGYNGAQTYNLLASSYLQNGDMGEYNKTATECIRKYPDSKSMFGQHYKYLYTLKSENNNQSMIYEEDKFKIEFDIQDNSIDFKLKNLSAKPIKIIWDNTSIVLFEEAHKVIHKEIKYTEKASHQPETLVPPKASISDLVIPIENIEYDNDLNKWVVKDLFPTSDESDEQLAQTIMSLQGTTFSLFMPMVIGDEEINIYVEFEIVDVIKE